MSAPRTQTSNKKLSRRAFAKLLGAAAVGGAALYAGTYLIPPATRFDYETANRSLKCVVPHSGEIIKFINENDEPFFLPPVAYSWFIDSRIVSTSRSYSCSLSETRTTGAPHIV
jgi:hypothetical protein